jgi:hypothetical protein
MTLEDDKIEALMRAAAERGYTVERGARNPQRPFSDHWIVRTREGALYGDPDSLLQRIERERKRVHTTTTKENEMSDKRLTQSPRALRDSTNDAEAFSKGSVNESINAFRRDGGPENAGIREGSRQRMEDINSRADRPRGIGGSNDKG